MPKPLVVFFGDSRAADWPPPDMPQFNFANRGVGGQTSAEALFYFESEVKPLRPQVVILQIGVNDLAALAFLPHPPDDLATACQHNIQQLVRQAVGWGATVIFTTIFPLGDTDLFFYNRHHAAEIAQAIETVNAFIHSLAAPEIIIFDTHAILVNEAGSVSSPYVHDFLHLNAAGYEALNGELVKVLRGLSPKV
ncbi:MAG: SGNH/GDSL hydrolase family protein [Anaerolineae bacterium]|nr:SGNH/GDSL hydrolase family protein [Anaerolineae bacterium]